MITGDEDFEQCLAEINVDELRRDFRAQFSYHFIMDFLRSVFSPGYKDWKNRGEKKINFIEKIKESISHLPPRDKVYLMLGALDLAQQEWGDFPPQGALYPLKLKYDDLVKVISSNSEDLRMGEFILNPNVIVDEAKNRFKEHLHKHPEIKDYLK